MATFTSKIDLDNKQFVGALDDITKSLGEVTKEFSIVGTKGEQAFAGIDDEVNKTNSSLKDTEEATKGLGSAMSNIGQIAAGMGLTELASSAASAFMELAGSLEGTRNKIAQLTGETGAALNNLASETQAVADTMDIDSQELASKVNMVAQAFGITYSDALTKVTEGTMGAANANGEYLDSVAEFGGKFEKLGFDIQQTNNYLAETQRQGIFGTKAADSIDEVANRLTEMTQGTKDALDAAGINSAKLQKDIESGAITQEKALEMVAQKTLALGEKSQVGQTLMADFWGGPVEDAPQLLKVYADLTNVMDGNTAAAKKETEEVKNKRIALEAEVAARKEVNLAITTLTGKVMPIFTSLMSAGAKTVKFFADNMELLLIPAGLLVGVIYQHIAAMVIEKLALLSTAGVTGIVTAAQWAWNAAMAANPIGLIIAALAVLGIAIYAIIKNFDAIIQSLVDMAQAVAVFFGFMDESETDAAKKQKKHDAERKKRRAQDNKQQETTLKNFIKRVDAVDSEAKRQELIKELEHQKKIKGIKVDEADKLIADLKKKTFKEDSPPPKSTGTAEKATLESLRERMVALKLAGKEGTEEFDKLLKKYRELEVETAKANNAKKYIEDLLKGFKEISKSEIQSPFESLKESADAFKSSMKELSQTVVNEKGVIEGGLSGLVFTPPVLDFTTIETSSFNQWINDTFGIDWSDLFKPGIAVEQLEQLRTEQERILQESYDKALLDTTLNDAQKLALAIKFNEDYDKIQKDHNQKVQGEELKDYNSFAEALGTSGTAFAQAATDAIGSSFAALIQGQANAGEAVLSFVLDTVSSMIDFYLPAILAAFSTLGPWGVPLGFAAIGAVKGLIQVAKSKVAGRLEGGPVPTAGGMTTAGQKYFTINENGRPEYIVNAKSTAKYRDIIELINQDKDPSKLLLSKIAGQTFGDVNIISQNNNGAVIAELRGVNQRLERVEQAQLNSYQRIGVQNDFGELKMRGDDMVAVMSKQRKKSFKL